PGFTEWTHVATAKPLFDGHYQPRIPADLGFYDLRSEDTQLKQIELAKKYGVYGFCYYYYWFSGKKLMELPIERHFNNNYEFPFCICWANENWSRRWDGSENEVLIAQQDTEGDALAFIEDISKYFHSPYYIKIKGAPFLIVYNLRKIPNPERIIRIWKEYVRSLGFPDLHVCMAETFGQDNSHGICDSACEFPPHKVVSRLINSKIEDLPSDFSGNIYDYEEVVANEIKKSKPSYILFRTIMGPWDNTPRRGKAGNIFHNFTPELFEAWLSFAVVEAKKELPPGMKFVFINAWNEWGEGTYLEPDRKYGHRLLQAVKNSLTMANMSLMESFLSAVNSSEDTKNQFDYLTTLKNSLDILIKTVTSFGSGQEYYKSKFIPFEEDVYNSNFKINSIPNKKCLVVCENINGRPFSIKTHILDRLGYLTLRGWQFVEDFPLTEYIPTYAVLIKDDEIKYFAQIYLRHKREDVAEHFKSPKDYFHGFSFTGELKRVDQGAYILGFLLPNRPNEYMLYKTDYVLFIG
ncbi:MAG: glycoside hydrolase family 99-like domain-containing protein, partial [Candidatus Omnitrophica bacterium]|nr:glycoside hydrolase family 99-like domain-containing protein [Candidatus Omnitrophota bacterium]